MVRALQIRVELEHVFHYLRYNTHHPSLCVKDTQPKGARKMKSNIWQAAKKYSVQGIVVNNVLEVDAQNTLL